jgi:hypothetical protein
MQIKSLAELRAADERVLRFTGLGFSTAGHLRPEDAAEFQQRVIEQCDLVSNVPEGTTRSFERLREMHSYGVLCYELYTVVDDLCPLVLEQALGERFVEYHQGTVPLVDRSGREAVVNARNFYDVHEALNKGGQYSRGGWQLRLTRPPGAMVFRGTLVHLISWARAEGLLRGQRNRLLEPVLVRMRNRVAHPTSYHLVMPVDSARSIRDLAEIVNHLWGSPTPGGRLYPAPVERGIGVIGWQPSTSQISIMSPQHLLSDQLTNDWQCVLVLAVEGDETLWDFDAQFETTLYPAELLWGPGRPHEAAAWLEHAAVQADHVEYMDRLVAVRAYSDGVDMPRRPNVFAALVGNEREGTWHLLKTDFPMTAWNHVREVIGASMHSMSPGACPACALETIIVGSWEHVLDEFKRLDVRLSPERPPAVKVPSPWRRHIP